MNGPVRVIRIVLVALAVASYAVAGSFIAAPNGLVWSIVFLLASGMLAFTGVMLHPGTRRRKP